MRMTVFFVFFFYVRLALNHQVLHFVTVKREPWDQRWDRSIISCHVISHNEWFVSCKSQRGTAVLFIEGKLHFGILSVFSYCAGHNESEFSELSTLTCISLLFIALFCCCEDEHLLLVSLEVCCAIWCDETKGKNAVQIVKLKKKKKKVKVWKINEKTHRGINNSEWINCGFYW